MYISRIYLENIRCFKELSLEFIRDSNPIIWSTILGDNATGKTTLLRSIALGICDESSAAGLLRESQEGYIRHGENSAKIEITFCDENAVECGVIKTNITKKGSEKFSFENLRQEVQPSKFPWEDIFICAYGIGRGSSGAGDISGYAPISAVYNLFNYAEGLQNPELVLRRIKESKSIISLNDIFNILKSILNLPKDAKIIPGEDDIKIKRGNQYKEISLRDMADGIKSTFQWLTDFLGWAISYNAREKQNNIRGIVLVDAIEEHLHPKWQRKIVNKLQESFSQIQFICTSHSPIIALGTTDIDNSMIIELDLNTKDKNEAIKKVRHPNEYKGLRVDQILTREAFDLPIARSGITGDMILEFQRLVTKPKLSRKENIEFKKLKEKIQELPDVYDSLENLRIHNEVRQLLTEIQNDPNKKST